MLEESGRERGEKSLDRSRPLLGHSDAPKPEDQKLTKIRHDGKSEDALGKIPLDASAEIAKTWLDDREKKIQEADGEL